MKNLFIILFLLIGISSCSISHVIDRNQEYKSLKQAYTNKYGVPTDSMDKFIKAYAYKKIDSIYSYDPIDKDIMRKPSPLVWPYSYYYVPYIPISTYSFPYYSYYPYRYYYYR